MPESPRRHLNINNRRPACIARELVPTDAVTSVKEEVTCLACKLTDAYLKLPPTETAGSPAVIPAHMRLDYYPDRTVCGITERTPLPANGRLIVPEWAMVSCPDCLRQAALETAGQPAVTLRHFAESAGGGYTRCGVERGKGVTPCTDMWSLVTCPDCLNIHSRESEIPMPEETPEDGIGYGSEQERITAEHRHDWNMVDGPTHVHDCEECIYLGTKYFVATYDLYWCSQGTRPTVIARRGEAGDYESGLDFVDRTPIMALAYVRAMQAGLVRR
jgi:hypothetical protein